MKVSFIRQKRKKKANERILTSDRGKRGANVKKKRAR